MVYRPRPRRHVHVGWPDQPCRHRRNHKALNNGGGPCGLPRDAPLHVSYPCWICDRPFWSIDARMMHVERHHAISRTAWERA